MTLELVIHALLIAGGFAGLYIGAELLVRGAIAASLRLNIPALIIGLTVVAFGTSAPEMVVSAVSALRGQPAVALGNVLGSNILNIALILGLLGIWLPITADKTIIRFDIPVMLGAYVILTVTLLSFFWPLEIGVISRQEGIILLGLLCAYLGSVYLKAKCNNAVIPPEIATQEIDKSRELSKHPWFQMLFMVLAGIVLLGIGGEGLVRGATWYASEVFKISDRIIGITVVAFATSSPELFTSLVALVKKESDISLGNIIGSNIFNTLGVVGIAALITPIRNIDAAFSLDLAMMISIAVFLWAQLAFRKQLTRIPAFILVLSLIVYAVIIIL